MEFLALRGSLSILKNLWDTRFSTYRTKSHPHIFNNETWMNLN